VKRIAFELDETLGVPLIEGSTVVGFQTQRDCLDLLGRPRPGVALFMVGYLPPPEGANLR
jgi:hypothetical protein